MRLRHGLDRIRSCRRKDHFSYHTIYDGRALAAWRLNDSNDGPRSAWLPAGVEPARNLIQSGGPCEDQPGIVPDVETLPARQVISCAPDGAAGLITSAQTP